MNSNMEREIYEISLDDIIPNRFQPRLTFDEEAMQELTASIKEHGVIQPLVLRRLGNKYEIIAGERRYKASTLAGLDKVPAIIMNLDDNKSAEVALVENIQRKQLTAIEEAKSYQQLLDRGYVTQEDLAKRLGKSQPGISNKMRLLNLTDEVQEALLANKISERHARSLLSLKDSNLQINMLERIIRERLTVRQTDAEIKDILDGKNILNNVEGVREMNNNENLTSNYPPIEPIMPQTPAENMSSIMDNNKFINIPTPVSPSQTEELDMDVDFQEIDEPVIKKMNDIDNMLRTQNQIPEFNPNLNQALTTQKRDIRPIISDIRQTVNNIQREGFVVDLEEFDYENTYQVVIKIEKN